MYSDRTGTLGKASTSMGRDMAQDLDCHGGTHRFVELRKKHFVGLLRAEHIDEKPSITALESIVVVLKCGAYTSMAR
jgi:hypothetical protein